MNDSPAKKQYQPPAVTFHGRLEELTGSTTLLVGARVVRFAAAFATSLHTPVPGRGTLPGTPVSDMVPTGGTGGEGAASVPTGGGGASGGGSPSGAGAGGGGGGGKLPFTGLAVIAVSGAGAALASAGVALRRFVRRGAADDA